MIDVSVLVSTCNRAPDIARLLECLEQQQLSADRRWELVVVDNNSTDQTATVVRNVETTNPYPIRYLFERRQGKSHALNSGLTVARGRLIAFTDDDVLPPSGWLQGIIDFFEAHPDATCIGGAVHLYNPDDAPVSIRLATEPATANATTFDANYIPIMGCNMAMRAGLIRQIGAFDVKLGPGTRLVAAEDLDYLYRVVRAGHQIHYAPDILVLHNHGRSTAEELEKLTRGYLLGRGAFYCKYLLKLDRRVTRWAYWELRENLVRTVLPPFSREAARKLRLLMKGVVTYLLNGAGEPRPTRT